MRRWLKKVRITEKLTCKEVADKCDFSPEFFSMIEKGSRRPSPDVAKKISKALNFKKYGYDWTKFYSPSDKEESEYGQEMLTDS